MNASKHMVVVMAWVIICLVEGLAYAQWARVDDAFDLAIPCVEYNGHRYEAAFQCHADPLNPSGLYWTIRSAADTAQTGECASISRTLDLVIPGVEYQSLQYSLSLHHMDSIDSQTGHFWKPGTVFRVAPSARVRDAAPTVPATDLADLVYGNNFFCLALYQAIPSGNDNLFFSPYSISMAIAMAYAGARRETLFQMAGTLCFILPGDRLHRAFNSLDLALDSRGEGLQLRGGERFRLNTVNNLWGQETYPFLPGFLDVLAENYSSPLALMDFVNAPENSRVVINAWVKDLTEGRIEDLIPPGGITPLTRMVLTNAIYFTASWEYPFDPEVTRNGIFHLLSGSQVTLPMMSQTEIFGYSEGEGYQTVELPYIGGALSMVIVVPGSGRFEDFEGSLTPSVLNEITGNLAPRSVQLTMPKFEYTSGSISLKQSLSQMGMPIAFEERADFSGISNVERLHIDDVLHKAFIAVDEAGTEAAAATAITIVGTGMPPQPVELIIDRPFILFIRDLQTGSILFMGRIVNP